MSTNRILLHLDGGCRHCRAQRVLDELSDRLERIEAAAGEDILEFWLPSVNEILDDGANEVRFLVVAKATGAPLDGDIAGHTAEELRRLSDLLFDAAERIDAFAKGGAL